MKILSQTNDGRKVEYEESFWTGKKRIIIDNIVLNKISKKEYMCNDTKYILSGSYLFGAKLESLDEDIILVRKLNVLEWILVVLPLVLVFIGGAIGGALGVASAITIATIVRKVNNVILKILVSLAITAVSIGLWWFIAILLLV